MITLNEIDSRAEEILRALGTLGSREKSTGLKEAARALPEGEGEILETSSRDYEKARFDGMSQGLLDRLKLTPARVQVMANGLLQMAALEDSVGEVLSTKLRSSGLRIGRKRVPLGITGMIYEVRPNVTADAFSSYFKSGNAIILKGGSDALHSSMAITRCLRAGLLSAGLSEDPVQLIEDTSRGTTRELMRPNRYIDVLISRGGAGLIKTVVENNTVSVMGADTGNRHMYVDVFADQNMALGIIFNAKTQRVGVCNAYESLLTHRSITGGFLPLLRKKLEEKQVEVQGDEGACTIEPSLIRATKEGWGREYLDYTLSSKLVDLVGETIRHIDTYSTGYPGTIVVSDYFNAQGSLNEVDVMAVYVNASTHLTDGEEFGFGAGIGISTRKLHARGPMGLKGLTTTRYIICEDGQTR